MKRKQAQPDRLLKKINKDYHISWSWNFDLSLLFCLSIASSLPMWSKLHLEPAAVRRCSHSDNVSVSSEHAEQS